MRIRRIVARKAGWTCASLLPFYVLEDFLLGFVFSVNPSLELPHSLTQVPAQLRQALGPEEQQDHQKYQQQVSR
jgi:uracil DNA glycosylase